jgi:hypothetical protein
MNRPWSERTLSGVTKADAGRRDGDEMNDENDKGEMRRGFFFLCVCA